MKRFFYNYKLYNYILRSCEFQTPLLQPYGEASNVNEFKEVRPPARREKRYGHLESAAAARQQRLDPARVRGDSVNSRYSSDPVKVLHVEGMLI